MKGKLIVVGGTDCSGKETQTKLLKENLEKENILVKRLFFPRYDTPTGKIIGGPLLGKKDIGECIFPEGIDVIPEVASLYYAADRKYNVEEIIDYLNKGYVVILDRYVESNMAHQAGKIFDKEKRHKMYDFISTLEYDLLELPKPDLTLFLYMPFEKTIELLEKRSEKADKSEESEVYLKNSEKTYLEMCELFKYKQINCVKENNIRTIEDINDEMVKIVKDFLQNK